MTDDTMLLSPRAGACAGTAALRSTAEDFVVDELLEPDFSGAGEHLWVRVRKRGQNTDFVARELARCAGVAPRAVGYAGRKDRHAVTSQWFSIQLPGRPDPALETLGAGIEVLEMHRHSRKLQTGYLQGNAFELVLRAITAEPSQLDARLSEIREHGVPNYFGAQRFGREGNNITRAETMFSGEARVRERGARSILLSAARAQVFNAVLAERVSEGSWSTLHDGDRAMLGTGRSHFLVESVDEELNQRLATRAIHPSGPLWGRGSPETAGAVAALERRVAGRFEVLCAGLERAGLDAQRRALRLFPDALHWEWVEADALRVRFRLPAGCFATTVLAEVLDCHDCLAGSGDAHYD